MLSLLLKLLMESCCYESLWRYSAVMKDGVGIRLIWKMVLVSGWYERWCRYPADMKYGEGIRLIWKMMWVSGWYEGWCGYPADMKDGVGIRLIWNMVRVSGWYEIWCVGMTLLSTNIIIMENKWSAIIVIGKREEKEAHFCALYMDMFPTKKSRAKI